MGSACYRHQTKVFVAVAISSLSSVQCNCSSALSFRTLQRRTVAMLVHWQESTSSIFLQWRAAHTHFQENS